MRAKTMTTLAAPAGGPARLLPFVAAPELTRAPLYAVMAYVAATFVLFLTWPIGWPIFAAQDWLVLSLYVLLCLFVLFAAAMFGSAGPTHLVAPLPGIPLLLMSERRRFGGTAGAIEPRLYRARAVGSAPARCRTRARAAYRRLQIGYSRTSARGSARWWSPRAFWRGR